MHPSMHWTAILASLASVLLPSKTEAAVAKENADTWREQSV